MKSKTALCLAFALGALGLGGCKTTDSGGDLSRLKMFFDNAIRFPADPWHQDNLGRINDSCTGFQIESTIPRVPGRFLVGTSHHCFGFATEEACADGKIHYRGSQGHVATCVGLAFQESRTDFVILEMAMESNDGSEAVPVVKAKRVEDRRVNDKRGFVLAAFSPPENTPVSLVGFPFDEEARKAGRAALGTGNCWVVASVASVLPHLPKSSLAKIAPNPGDFGLHNCSVFGGNSGGPLISEESNRVVIGIPQTFSANLDTRSSTDLDTAAHYESMGGIVRRFRSELEAAGARIVMDKFSPPTAQGDFYHYIPEWQEGAAFTAEVSKSKEAESLPITLIYMGFDRDAGKLKFADERRRSVTAFCRDFPNQQCNLQTADGISASMHRLGKSGFIVTTRASDPQGSIRYTQR